jgi:hypothetical protein
MILEKIQNLKNSESQKNKKLRKNISEFFYF